MESSIFKYILRYSTKQQIILTILAAVSLPFLWWFYDLPKYIINEVIQGPALTYTLPFLGTEVDKIPYLMMAAGLFLVLILVNQAFKYVINVYRGITGERMLRRLRYDLYARVLRFPRPTFRKLSQGEIIAMVTAEVEPLGGFIAEAFSLVAFQGGTLLVILGFLLYQNWYMALAAIALYPVQFYLIPKLQRRVNALGKERVRLVRRLSERIGESVQGVQEVHAHDTANLELAEFSRQLGVIYNVRFRIYVQKFVIKFLNNTIQQLGPFFFYSIGGYLVITGELEIGTLVAAIAAHKDLGAPWKELLTYYQRMEDSRIKYEQVVNQFAPAGTMPAELQLDEPPELPRFTGTIQVSNLTLLDDQGNSVIDGLSAQLGLDKRIAIVGPSGSGSEELAMLLARLLTADRGSISIAGHDLAGLPEGITGRRIAYVGPTSFVFNASLGDNLYYGLKHRPLRPVEYHGEDEKAWTNFEKEAAASGNTTYDINADWIDYQAAGADGPQSLRSRALEVLEVVDMAEDVYQFGLRGAIDPQAQPEVATAILGARTRLRERLEDPEIATLIEIFDRNSYNNNATVGENLLFGNPVDDAFDMERLAEHPYVQQVLDKVSLSQPVLQMGYQVAATMVELFADLPPDHELFQQFSFISADDLPETQALLQRADKSNLAALSPDDRNRLMSLPFKLIQARHRLGLISEEFKEKILEARHLFAAELPDELSRSVEFFDVERYNAAANLQDNILFGKVAYGQAQAAERVGALIREVVDELDLRDTVAEVGLNFQVGVGGSRLSGSQRQKLGIARAIMKRPEVLILSEATASLDSGTQQRIMQALLQDFEGRSLIWVVHQPATAQAFDHVLVVRQGRLVEQGTPGELSQQGEYFKQLIAAE